jgi:hypothetical protein
MIDNPKYKILNVNIAREDLTKRLGPDILLTVKKKLRNWNVNKRP